MRETPPPIGPPDRVRFPPIARVTLPGGLRVWTIEERSVPTVTATFVVRRGAAADPPGRPGLSGVAVDLVDEGAGGRDAIELADAFADLGCELVSDVGPDATTLGFSSVARVLPAALRLLGDVVRRPAFLEPDFRRVVELRKHRLAQRSRSAGAVADRALGQAIFGAHPYGHSALGTTASLDEITLDEARGFWMSSCEPGDATLIVAGDVEPALVADQAATVFGDWVTAGHRAMDAPSPAEATQPVVHFVERPGAAQSELRVGHLGPPRLIPEYHGLVVLNALLGGQFASRINRNLRETRGLTYGARTSFVFRRFGGTFLAEASVQGDRTAEAAAEVLREFDQIREEVVPDAELERARDALSRGYVRLFETASQYARAAEQLTTYDLDDQTFDRFVPAVEAVLAGHVRELARRFVRPADAVIVVVGDPQCRSSLDALGRNVVMVSPEF